MYSLPPLAPQDSYSLWYTSSNSSPLHTEPSSVSFDHAPSINAQPGQNGAPHSSRRHHGQHRSPLARLRLDEEYMERRKQNIQNYGNAWIKPPGIPKTLYQMREEKREQEEHQEALRREALAQELADAEAEGAAELLQGEGMDGEMDEVRDLDDLVPEADTTGVDAEDSENEDFENDVEEVPRGVLASRMPDDVYREALVHGEEVRANRFGVDGGSTIDEEDASQMLQEEDLVIEGQRQHLDMDMDMDADLDDDIPEAEDGGYEHTDTEEELSSSEDESVDNRFPQRVPVTTSMVRSDGTQNSMDMGGSSQLGSSPHSRIGFRGRRSGN